MTTPSPSAGVLRELHGTPPFLEFCRLRAVPFAQAAGAPLPPDGLDRWEEALATLPDARRAGVECDLERVAAVADGGVGFLLRAVPDAPPDDVPYGAPAALWCLMRHPDLFGEAFWCREAASPGRWRVARLSAVPEPLNGAAVREAVRDELRAFLGRADSVVEAGRGDWSCCLTGSVPDRPSLEIAFAHPPGGRVVLLRSALPPDREGELLERLCAAVLKVGPCAKAAHDLAPLKGAFRPLPDAPDMESVRLRALHLRYPGRLARRRLALETLPGDGPFAVEEMLHEHVADRGLLDSLDVCFAELQVRLRVPGGVRAHAVRLWRDHANLGPGPFGDRLRRCLARWGLSHAE